MIPRMYRKIVSICMVCILASCCGIFFAGGAVVCTNQVTQDTTIENDASDRTPLSPSPYAPFTSILRESIKDIEMTSTPMTDPQEISDEGYPSPPPTNDGLAQGKVGLVFTQNNAYGYSGYTNQWTSTELNGEHLQSRVSDTLGLVLTTEKVYAFKPLCDRWTKSTYAGTPVGLDVEGPTALFWTTQALYGTATIWIIWHSTALRTNEMVLGGGSAGMFGIVWTNQRAIAYCAGNGQWISQEISESVIDGITTEELGLVWTANHAYAFSSSCHLWRSATLEGLHASGSGNVGVIWNQDEALAFSKPLDTWIVHNPDEPIRGAKADGDVAVLWTEETAYAFSAPTGTWHSQALESPPLQVFVKGNAALVQTQGILYGFTNLDTEYESWSSVHYLGDVLTFLISDYSGLLVTTSHLYAYKASATQNRWTISRYYWTPAGQDIQGATALFWTDIRCYGTSSVRSYWDYIPLEPGEPVVGGGSAGNFGVLWTHSGQGGKVFGYHSATGEWISELISGVTINGIVSQGLGMVWGEHTAYAFEPIQGLWMCQELGASVVERFGAGDKQVGVLWNETDAYAYSTLLAQWYHLNAENAFQSGTAAGETAVLWTESTAYSFSASTGLWYSSSLQ